VLEVKDLEKGYFSRFASSEALGLNCTSSPEYTF